MINKVDNESIFIISYNLNTYIGAGIPLLKALNLVENSLKNKRYKISLGNLVESINRGKSLSEALKEEKKLYPDIFSDMIKIGEESGSLEKVLSKLSEHFKRNCEIRKNIIKLCSYPVLLIFIALLGMIFYLIFILPNFNELFKSIEGSNNKFLNVIINYIDFIENNPYATIIILSYFAIFSLVLLMIFMYTKEKNILMNISLVKLYYESNIIFILQLIISSGIPILSSLYILRDTLTNKFLKNSINSMIDKLKSGESLSEAISTVNVISQISHNFIFSGEEAGKLESNIELLSFMLEKNLKDKITYSLKFIEPVLIGIVTMLVMFMFLLVFIPMQEFMNYV